MKLNENIAKQGKQYQKELKNEHISENDLLQDPEENFRKLPSFLEYKKTWYYDKITVVMEKEIFKM